jgi:hypothetical protein
LITHKLPYRTNQPIAVIGETCHYQVDEPHTCPPHANLKEEIFVGPTIICMYLEGRLGVGIE